MNDLKKAISFKNILLALSILTLLVSISGIGYFLFFNWFSATGQIAESMARSMNSEICGKIRTFLHTPEHLNDMYYNLIQNGTIDLSDENERDSFFVGALGAHTGEVYSFSFGGRMGDYYGARRNEEGTIEIMRNNADTGGNSWYYSVKDDMTSGELVADLGQFDPRTRDWYKVAVAANKPAFSPVYVHFAMKDLAVSASRPIYGKDGSLLGVLGSHVLLSGISGFLKEAESNYSGYGIIIEKNSGNLIGNSMNLDNFTLSEENELERKHVSEIESHEISRIYGQLKDSQDQSFLYKGENEKLYVYFEEFDIEGISWIVISAVPEAMFLGKVKDSIRTTVYLGIAALMLLLFLYFMAARRYLNPVDSLLEAAEILSGGDLSQRVPIIRNDEIGRISQSFNKVADEMQFLINNLESAVVQRTEELNKSNEILAENKNRLRLILDSTGEGIYGIDTKGNCTFCNSSCLKMLGYSREEDMLGKNMHRLIHHSYESGSPMPEEECKIFMAFKKGKGTHSDDEVLWRSDGTSFKAEYRSYPKTLDGVIIGAVVTFTDITERKEKEEAITFLSCYDGLTGLYNRQCFEIHLRETDKAENLPLSVIFADINGLKLTNDIFGHTAGDSLIKRIAEIIKKSCRDNDIVSRVGGDEFIILLPKTNIGDAQRIMDRIRDSLSNERVEAIKCSISIGVDTKTHAKQSIESVIGHAESEMYKGKTLNRREANMDIIDTIVDTLHARYPDEKKHSEVVSRLSGDMGAALGLPDAEISKLKRAGYMHDIGKIVLNGEIQINDKGDREHEEIISQHTTIGYRILNLFEETLDLAEHVYNHHERWDGKGYPRGLKEDQIPLISRIIAIAEVYDRVLRRGSGSQSENKKQAVAAIRDGAGKRFDPGLAKLFIDLVES